LSGFLFAQRRKERKENNGLSGFLLAQRRKGRKEKNVGEWFFIRAVTQRAQRK
jgi:hypothetical protein